MPFNCDEGRRIPCLTVSKSYVPEHIVSDASLHVGRDAVFILDASLATVSGKPFHFLHKLIVLLQLGFGLRLLVLVLARFGLCVFGLFVFWLPSIQSWQRGCKEAG